MLIKAFSVGESGVLSPSFDPGGFKTAHMSGLYPFIPKWLSGCLTLLGSCINQLGWKDRSLAGAHGVGDICCFQGEPSARLRHPGQLRLVKKVRWWRWCRAPRWPVQVCDKCNARKCNRGGCYWLKDHRHSSQFITEPQESLFSKVSITSYRGVRHFYGAAASDL